MLKALSEVQSLRVGFPAARGVDDLCRVRQGTAEHRAEARSVRVSVQQYPAACGGELYSNLINRFGGFIVRILA